MKRLFRRRNIEKTQLPGKMPKEVEEYYKERQRSQKIIPFLLMLATVVVTLVLSLGIFYGGKWAYRQIKGTKNTAITETTKPSAPVDQPKTPTNGSQPNSTSGDQAGQTPNSPTATTPSTGPSDTIPHTGPTGDLN